MDKADFVGVEVYTTLLVFFNKINTEFLMQN